MESIPFGCGFNLQNWFSWKGKPPTPVDLRILDFMAAEGFTFLRWPMDYRFWVRDHRYREPDLAVLEGLREVLEAARSRGIHLCLNLHRAPGYCINRPETEPHNLWTESEAQDGFAFQWRTLARMFRGVPGAELSFDLLNEPPHETWKPKWRFSRAAHEQVMRQTLAAIREEDLDRPVVVDGLGAGNHPLPELADTGATQSTRGYQPMPVSHFKAEWVEGHESFPQPVWPGLEWDGKFWDVDVLREHYRPWRELEATGVRVHVGEFGCHSHTPQSVALAWLRDLVGLFREFGWGYALWRFDSRFGISGHGRAGARWETRHGIEVDRDMLEILRP